MIRPKHLQPGDRIAVLGGSSPTSKTAEELTQADIGAKLEHGVLSINVPKKEAKKLPEKQTIMIEG